MKKYRCPCCGEESITLSNKIFSYEVKNPRARYVNYDGNRCPSCGGVFLPIAKYKNSLHTKIIFILTFISFIYSIYLVFFVNTNYAFIYLALMIILPLIIAPIFNINRAITMYDRKSNKHIIPETNAKFAIEKNTNKIDNLDIYGVKFHKKTNKVRFHEAFTNQLVPVVFHKNSKNQQGELEVTIMKMEFIPKELLVEGSKFTVVDNGKEVATGEILMVYEQ